MTKIHMGVEDAIKLCDSALAANEVNCARRIAELTATTKQKVVTEGFLWWKTTRPITQAEVDEFLNTPDDDEYPDLFPSPIGGITQSRDRRKNRIEQIKSVAVVSLAYGGGDIIINDTEAALITKMI